jgi:HlyD family secretion protein
VLQVRQNPVTTSNVVTYTTVVLVDNQDGALRPGMTASATIQVAHVDNATIVPLAAFSYQPPTGAVKRNGPRQARTGGTLPLSSSKGQGDNTQSGNKTASSSPWGATSASSGGAVTAGSRGRIFVLRGGKLVPVPVKVGLVGDTQASVTPLRGTLGAGDQVVIGDNAAATATRGARSGSGNPLSGQNARPQGGGRGGPLGGAR